jgi:thiol:disulfide interchange protein DsbC
MRLPPQGNFVNLFKPKAAGSRSFVAALAAALALVWSSVAFANSEAIKKEVEKRYPEIKVERVTKTDFNNLWEVFANNEIFYTDEKVGFLVLGSIIDTSTRANLTDQRLAKLTAIKFEDLPFENAIKLVRGNGSRKLAVFEDPNCGYCKRFEQDLNSLDNITAYIFPYPILSPDSAEKSKAVWCSTDRLKAWQDLMLRGQQPTAKGTCDNPVDKIVALGQRLRINGTPLTFFQDGERVPGAVSKERLESRLVAAAGAAKSGAK